MNTVPDVALCFGPFMCHHVRVQEWEVAMRLSVFTLCFGLLAAGAASAQSLDGYWCNNGTDGLYWSMRIRGPRIDFNEVGSCTIKTTRQTAKGRTIVCDFRGHQPEGRRRVVRFRLSPVETGLLAVFKSLSAGELEWMPKWLARCR